MTIIPEKIKELAFEVRDHFKTDFNKPTYIVVILLAVVYITLEYTFKIEKALIQPIFGTFKGIVVHILFYAVIYYSGMISILLIKKQKEKLRNPHTWIKSFLFIAIIGTFCTVSYHIKLARVLGGDAYEITYLWYLFAELQRIVPYLILLGAIFWIYDRGSKNFYGLGKTDLSYKPFFYMLLMVLPLVIAASFLPDFQSYYPRFKYWHQYEVYGLSKLVMNIIFLVCYATDFVGVEIIFRGAMVIAMIKYLGKESVLAMVLLYMSFHFGKPIGETISSFFGGYILGVFAYNHKNIKGGIIVHIGLAWIMELLAILQYIRLNE